VGTLPAGGVRHVREAEHQHAQPCQPAAHHVGVGASCEGRRRATNAQVRQSSSAMHPGDDGCSSRCQPGHISTTRCIWRREEILHRCPQKAGAGANGGKATNPTVRERNDRLPVLLPDCPSSASSSGQLRESVYAMMSRCRCSLRASPLGAGGAAKPASTTVASAAAAAAAVAAGTCARSALFAAAFSRARFEPLAGVAGSFAVRFSTRRAPASIGQPINPIPRSHPAWPRLAGGPGAQAGYEDGVSLANAGTARLGGRGPGAAPHSHRDGRIIILVPRCPARKDAQVPILGVHGVT